MFVRKNEVILLVFILSNVCRGAECKLSSPTAAAEVTSWLQNRIKGFLSGKQVQAQLEKELRQCRNQFPQIKECTQTFLDYLQTKNQKNPFIDAQKNAGLEYIGVNSLPQPIKTKEFLEAVEEARMDREESFHALKQELSKINAHLAPDEKWRFVAYQSTGIAPAIDGSGANGRGILFIPENYINKITPDGPARDLFLQFTVREKQDTQERFVGQFSALALIPGKPRTYFLADHLRRRPFSEETLKHTDWIIQEFATHPIPSLQPNTSACYTCHSSGSIAITPSVNKNTQSKFMYEYEKGDLRRINSHLVSARSAFELDPPSWLMIGETSHDDESRKDLDEFFSHGSCFDGVSPTTKNRVKQEINCTNCHNEKGTPRFPIYLGAFGERQMTFHKVVNGPMPPYSSLDREEQAILFRCLEERAIEKAVKYLSNHPTCPEI